MKILWGSLFFSLLGSAGCMELPSLGVVDTAPAPTLITQTSARPLPPVTADQVTESNAHEKAKALQEELSREMQEEPLPAKTSRPSPEKP